MYEHKIPVSRSHRRGPATLASGYVFLSAGRVGVLRREVRAVRALLVGGINGGGTLVVAYESVNLDDLFPTE